MNLILLAPGEVDDAQTVTLRDARAAHIRAVLRAACGDEVRVGLIDGPLGAARVTAIDEVSVTLACGFSGDAPPRPRVDLLLAVPRPKVLGRLWAQLAALGVGRIILTNAARVERNYFDTHFLREDVYRALLVEGLQQARDTRLPHVSIHRRLKVLIEDELDGLTDAGVRVIADPSGSQRVGEALRADATARVVLAVGPEGGWVPYERDLLASHGFRAVDMGPRTLRSDTACIALLALVHDAISERG
ncbi:MAG: 16S rRNA (uracil(1498)-N(3))-methyltransferase [Acidobacteria bacterium]|nr:16S rRNA (uracil(1498)-N(3))-methyltransferase [Acidobacteriota bacterium]